MPDAMRVCEVRDFGRMPYSDAMALQRSLVELRKQDRIPDQLLYVEHPHVITLGRNGNLANLLAGDDVLRRAGVELHHADRGGDITYHGPGQIVAYPVFDLRKWNRDVVAYVRTLEQVLVDSLAEFGIESGRLAGCTGVWVLGKKVAAIGVHISRWVTSHGFALNHTTDLSYFQYIVPCGLTKPVTSLLELGSKASRDDVISSLTGSFARSFHLDIQNRDGPAHGREPAVSLLETFS